MFILIIFYLFLWPLYYLPFCCLIFKRSMGVASEAVFYSIITTIFLIITSGVDAYFYFQYSSIYYIIKALWLMFSVAVVIFSYYKKSVFINSIGVVLLLSVTNPSNFIWVLFSPFNLTYGGTPISCLIIIICIIGILLFIAGFIHKIIGKNVIFLDVFSDNFLAASYSILLLPASFMTLSTISNVFGVLDESANFLDSYLLLSVLLFIMVCLKLFMGKKDKK